jgi:hypothetical protein
MLVFTDASVLKAIRDFENIKTLVFVSCDPSGLIQNSSVYVQLLTSTTMHFINIYSSLCRAPSKQLNGVPFRLVKYIAVDLFPHTDRMEVVALFERDWEWNQDAFLQEKLGVQKDQEQKYQEQDNQEKDDEKQHDEKQHDEKQQDLE